MNALIVDKRRFDVLIASLRNEMFEAGERASPDLARWVAMLRLATDLEQTSRGADQPSVDGPGDESPSSNVRSASDVRDAARRTKNQLEAMRRANGARSPLASSDGKSRFEVQDGELVMHATSRDGSEYEQRIEFARLYALTEALTEEFRRSATLSAVTVREEAWETRGWPSYQFYLCIRFLEATKLLKTPQRGKLGRTTQDDLTERAIAVIDGLQGHRVGGRR